MGFADSLLSTGERITHREKQHWFVFVWGARFTILALIVGRHPAGVRQLEPRGTGPLRDVLSWIVGGHLHRRTRGPALDAAPLPEPGVRHHQPPCDAGRRRAQQALDRQLAREDQRRAS